MRRLLFFTIIGITGLYANGHNPDITQLNDTNQLQVPFLQTPPGTPTTRAIEMTNTENPFPGALDRVPEADVTHHINAQIQPSTERQCLFVLCSFSSFLVLSYLIGTLVELAIRAS